MTQLNFKGKEFVYNHHLAVPHRPLEIHEDKSVGKPSLNTNLLIHDDNLHALKSLLPFYAGAIDCIFIDPPYNTGSENWYYSDNVNAPMINEWFSNNPVTIEDGLRHDKWCAMMWPRLRLLHELLSDNGFIFVCIDNNESARLKLLMDEIFGEKNFRNEIIFRRGIKNVQSQFEDIDSLSVGHDTLYLYSKDPENRLPKLMTLAETDEPGKWDTFWRGTDRETMRYELFGKTPSHGQWRWKQSRALQAKQNYEEFLQHYAETMTLDDFYHLKAQETGTEVDFVRINDDGVVQYYVPPRNYKLMSDVWMRLSASGRYTTFPHEKHVDLVETAINWVTTENSVVLDSFVGSGTTAHAVLRANLKDGGHRKFIAVEMEDYAETVTAERIRKAIEECYQKNNDLAAAGGYDFTFCTLGKAIDLDKILTGKELPSFANLGATLFHIATNQPLDTSLTNEEMFYLGESLGRYVWLIYRPDREWLKSGDAALTLSRAKQMQATAPEQAHLVFAPTRFVSQRLLEEHDLNVEFVPLPFSLYRIEKDQS